MNKIKKAGILCSLLGLSLYTNAAYAKGYNGDINFRCSFKIGDAQLGRFTQFIKDFDLTSEGVDTGIVNSTNGADFVFWGVFQGSKDYVAFDFIDAIPKKMNEKTRNYVTDIKEVDTDIKREIVFKNIKQPFFNSTLTSDATGLKLEISVKVKKETPWNNKVGATFTYTYAAENIKDTLLGNCNFVGTPYSKVDSDKENQEPSVVIHPQANNQ